MTTSRRLCDKVVSERDHLLAHRSKRYNPRHGAGEHWPIGGRRAEAGSRSDAITDATRTVANENHDLSDTRGACCRLTDAPGRVAIEAGLLAGARVGEDRNGMPCILDPSNTLILSADEAVRLGVLQLPIVES